MSIIGRLWSSLWGSPKYNSAPQSRYESSRITDANKSLWTGVDAKSPNNANDPATRFQLRNRSRYEEANNGYVAGLISDRANETIGTGPRLQLTLPEQYTDPDFQRTVAVPPDAARQVELKWCEWCESVGLLDKLLVLDMTESRDGEVFGLKFSNPLLPPDAPQLDLRLYEAEQCTTPYLDITIPGRVDGILFDRHGNPIQYDFLRVHPGEAWVGMQALEFDSYPARRVIHFHTAKRPGQARGVPSLQSSLNLYGVQRAFTNATLQTAEKQARILGTIESTDDLPMGDDEEPDDTVPMQQIPFGASVLMELPAGKKANAFQANQPGPGYKEFKNEIITEAGRPMNAPRSVSTGSSAEYNYSSARLDLRQWQRMIRIRRQRIARIVLNDLYRAWYAEARLIPGYLPDGLPPFQMWQWIWRWDGFVSIDPVKDAQANQIALSSGQTSLDRVAGESGEDWEQLLEQQAREMRKRAELGLPPLSAPAAAPAADPSQQEDTQSAY